MKKDYSLSEPHYSKMVAPIMRDTKLSLAIRNLDYGPLIKALQVMR